MHRRNLVFCTLFASLAFLILAGTVSAGLVLTIDTTAKKFWLTGSATGQLNLSLSRVVWVMGSNSSATATGLTGDPAALVGSTGNPVSAVAVGATTSGGFTFSLRAPFNNSTLTLSGLGQTGAFDYSGVDPTVKARFEAGIGKSASLSEGSGFGVLTVQGGTFGPTAVPEPGTWAAAALLAGGAALARSRKRAKVS